LEAMASRRSLGWLALAVVKCMAIVESQAQTLEFFHRPGIVFRLQRRPSGDLHNLETGPDRDWTTFGMNVLTMFLLKLVCGLDDIAVLTALVGTEDHVLNNVNSALYFGLFVVIGLLSWVIAEIIYDELDQYFHSGFWTVDKLSALFCGIILMLLGMREYYLEKQENEKIEEIEEIAEEGSAFAEGDADGAYNEDEAATFPLVANGQRLEEHDERHSRFAMNQAHFVNVNHEDLVGDKDDFLHEGGLSTPNFEHVEKVREEEEKAQETDDALVEEEFGLEGRFRYAAVILMLAVDDAIVFVCVIEGSKINLIDVFLGMSLGALLIVMICRAFSSITWLNDRLQQIPKWVLIFCLGIWVIISGFVKFKRVEWTTRST